MKSPIIAYQVGEIYEIPLSQLVYSTAFQSRSAKERASAKYRDGLEELAPLILSMGVLQNLCGFQLRNGKKLMNSVEIYAGGRRLDSLALLASRGQIDPATYKVKVRIGTVQDALKESLAENSAREPLSKADQFRNFKLLADNGFAPAEISTAFGVDELTVTRRLKLGNVSPRLFDLYEDGKATLDQLMALALTDDHDAQEQVWDSLPTFNRSANAIRARIAKTEISTKTSRAARFVGVEEYEAAGGQVLRDLFAEKDEGYFTDAVLLESLAVAKMERMTPDTIKHAGWGWIEYTTEDGAHNVQYRFRRLPKVDVPMSEEDEARKNAIDARLHELEELLTSDTGEDENEDEEGEGSDPTASTEEAGGIDFAALEEERTKLEAEFNALEEKYQRYDPEQMKKAGVVVGLNFQDELQFWEGLVRLEDVAEAFQAEEQSDDAAPQKAARVHSDKLTRQLNAHRIAAVRALLTSRADVALVVLTHKLVLSVFDQYGHTYGKSAVCLDRPHMTPLNQIAADFPTSRAATVLADAGMKWADVLPTDKAELFGWLLAQPEQIVKDLLAYCVACTIDAMCGDEVPPQHITDMSRAVNLDMTEWWTATRESYFNQMKKPDIISILTREVSPDLAGPLAVMKKGELADTAEQKLAGTKWLPEMLKQV